MGVIRMNRAEKRREIVKQWSIGRASFVFQCRSSKCLWGRFGGGWNWKLGFQVGGSTVIVNLLVCSLTVSLAARTAAAGGEKKE